MKAKTIVAHTRLPAPTYILLDQISKAVKLKKSTLIRAAVSQWLRNAPEDLPVELKIAIATQLMKDNIETIKQLRWIYYQAYEAKLKIKNSEALIYKAHFPPHVRKALRQLERNILNQHNQLDTWLKTQFPMRSYDANVQNVYKDTERK